MSSKTINPCTWSSTDSVHPLFGQVCWQGWLSQNLQHSLWLITAKANLGMCESCSRHRLDTDFSDSSPARGCIARFEDGTTSVAVERGLPGDCWAHGAIRVQWREARAQSDPLVCTAPAVIPYTLPLSRVIVRFLTTWHEGFDAQVAVLLALVAGNSVKNVSLFQS